MKLRRFRRRCGRAAAACLIAYELHLRSPLAFPAHPDGFDPPLRKTKKCRSFASRCEPIPTRRDEIQPTLVPPSLLLAARLRTNRAASTARPAVQVLRSEKLLDASPKIGRADRRESASPRSRIPFPTSSSPGSYGLLPTACALTQGVSLQAERCSATLARRSRIWSASAPRSSSRGSSDSDSSPNTRSNRGVVR